MIFYYITLGLLMNIITTIFQNNEKDSRRRLFIACAIYSINITNGMSYRTINKENIFFNRIILTPIGK